MDEKSKKEAAAKEEAAKKEAAAKEAGIKAAAEEAAKKEADSKDEGDKKEAAADPTEAGVDAQSAQDASGDAEQDEQTFKKLIADYLGGEHADNAEAMGMAKESYGAAKEAGMPHDEAMKCAGYAMKASAHMGAARAKKEAASKEAAAKESAAKEAAEAEAAAKKEAGKGVKESAAPANTKLIAENAALKQKLRERDLKDHLDKVLKESKLKVSVTKVFREQIAKSLKTEEEITSAFKTFNEAFAEAESGRDDDSLDGFGACLEKITNPNMSASAEGTSDGFDDCLN